MLDIVHRVTLGRLKKAKNIPEFSAGDTVSVYVKVKEGEKERVQVYTGVVLKIQGNGMSRSFTVRKVSSGVGVERTFPFLSPAIERVETVSQGRVRKSRLYYLRGLKGRAARLKSELVHAEGETVGAADDIPTPEEKVPAAAPVEAPAAKAKEAAPKKD